MYREDRLDRLDRLDYAKRILVIAEGWLPPQTTRSYVKLLA